ncbi:hypothetical protein WDW86_09515 [Bdellovibrionota bacterium FG-2]
MTNSKSSKPPRNSEGTRIDLGEDLLDDSPIVLPEVLEVSAPLTAPPETSDDEFESARILLSEGLVEDAKKILRKLLRSDTEKKGNTVAVREMLDRIQKTELDELIRGNGQLRARFRSLGPLEKGALSEVDSEALMRKLDQDFGLGLFPDRTSEQSSHPLALFGSQEAMDQFATKLEGDLKDASVQDRLDVGIAFLEMGLYILAGRQFEAAIRIGHPPSMPALALLSYAWLLAERPFEAIGVLQPHLGKTELTQEEKLEFFYLMGRAHESLHKLESAFFWYQKIQEMDYHYRDVSERMDRLVRSASDVKG